MICLVNFFKLHLFGINYILSISKLLFKFLLVSVIGTTIKTESSILSILLYIRFEIFQRFPSHPKMSIHLVIQLGFKVRA